MLRTRFPSLAPLCLLVGASFGGSAAAQSWEINDEIDFAKNMARYRLFDLSSEHLDNLARTDLPEDDNLAILYARAMLFRIAGEYASGVDARMDYLQKATTGYDDFLSRASDTHDQFSLAQGEAAEVQRSLGSMLAQQLASGTAEEGTKDRAEEAFRAAVERLNKEFRRKQEEYNGLDLEDKDEQQRNELLIEAFRPLYHLAATYYEFSQLYEAGEFNREDYLTKCYETAEEFLWEAPSDSFLAYQVYYYAGLAFIGLGQPEEGFSRLNFIISSNSGLPAWVENDPDIPQAWATQITQHIEKTYLAMARAYNDAGQYEETEKALAKLDRYYSNYADRGCERGPVGEECLIELGRALHAQGKPEGMAMLRDVANRHASDELGAKAAEAIGGILEAAGLSVEQAIPAPVWLTAAAAAQDEGKFFDALSNYHKALAALPTISDETERLQTAVDCHLSIGKLYRGENRLVEAAAALEAGMALPGVTLDHKKSLGSALFNTLTRRYSETKDKDDGRRKDQKMDELARMGLDDMNFLVARDDFDSARALPASEKAKRDEAFSEAVKNLKRVKKDDDNYERALILLARCEAEQENYAKAIKEIDDFFDRTQDKRYEIGGTARVKQRNRDISMCEGTYYKAEYSSELGKHEEVLVILEGFEEKFPTQDKFFKLVNYLRLRSHLACEPPQITEAEKLFEEKYAVGQLPLEAQYFLARALLDKATEADASDPEKAKSLRGRGAGHMFSYCQKSGFTSYANLKVAGDSYMDVGDHANAEKVYLKIVDTFGRDAKYRDRIERTVKRNLADALLAQDKFQEAANIYKELLASFGQTDLGIMKQAARCFGGRVDVDDAGRASEVPGAGHYKEAVELWDTITERGFDAESKYNLDWWEAKYYAIYARYRAKATGPEWMTDAKKIVQNLNTSVLSFYKKPGTDRIDWEAVFEGQSPEVVEQWQARFEYLFDRLR